MGMGNWSVAFCSASNIWWMIPGASILHFILNNCICFLRTRILGAGIKVDSTVHSFRIRDDNFYCLHLAYPTKIQFGVVALCRTGLRKAGLAWPGHTDRHKTVSCQAPLLLHRKNQRQQISEGVIFPAIDVDIYRYRSVGGLGRWLQRLIVGMVGPVPAW